MYLFQNAALQQGHLKGLRLKKKKQNKSSLRKLLFRCYSIC